MKIWSDVPLYEKFYKINIHGEIVSKISGRKLNPWATSSGYIQVQLAKPRKKFQVHRLLAMAFIPNPENKECINHINSNRSDNRLENLEWATVKENNETANRLPRRCPHCNEILYAKEKQNCKKPQLIINSINLS